MIALQLSSAMWLVSAALGPGAVRRVDLLRERDLRSSWVLSDDGGDVRPSFSGDLRWSFSGCYGLCAPSSTPDVLWKAMLGALIALVIVPIEVVFWSGLRSPSLR